MNILLDTHIVLWWLDDAPALSAKARALIADPQNLVFVSAAVIWEIQIKKALGKLEIPDGFRSVMARQPFEYLDINDDHAYAISALPLHHRDPFDRIQVAQAKVERLNFVSHDVRLNRYDIPIIQA
jgi:PIN domain nuclease of toxin-antitoxin system